MTLTISKWGNSQGIRLPKDLLDKLHARIGSDLNVEYKDGKVILETIEETPKYDIHELAENISEYNKSTEVDWGSPEGEEVW